MNKTKQNLQAIIYLFFIISGATGLIYQIVWFKYLSLFLGNTTYAQTIVLATFLGGLSIGNYFFGKKSDFLKNGIFTYGLLETLIGIYCLGYPTLVSLTEKIFFKSVSGYLIIEQNFLYLFIKFIISAIVLIFPTILMGGTLPILTKFFTEHIGNVREENAKLYFLNSFGAVFGIFFAGFVLIKNFGLENTLIISAIFNLLIGGISIFLSTLALKSSSTLNNVLENTEKDNQFSITKTLLFSVTFIAGASGFTALMYEVLWTRVLISIFGSSTYSFSLMLMAFISGITIGSFIISSSFISNFNRIRLLSLIQLFIAIFVLISLLIFNYLPFLFWKIAYLFNKTESSFTLFLAFEFIICFFLMLLPTIFMGMSLPLSVEITARAKNLVGFSVGKIFSVNTFGTVLGVIATGLILIPNFGVKNSFEIGIFINLLLSFLLILTSKEIRKIFGIVSVTVSLIVLFILYIQNNDWDKNLFTSSVFRRLSDTPPPSFSEYQKIFTNRELIYFKDGTSANISVLETKESEPQKILLVNGKPDASSVKDMPTQLLVGHIPMLIHKKPEKVFVIGLGSGSTVGAVLSYDVNNVIVSENSKEVIDAAKFFEKENNKCLEDPRVTIIIEDAQSYLKMTKEKFDVIISEPSNPWISGIGNLFSKEYFERCKNSLANDGIMTQWFHIYEMDDNVLNLVIKTFNSVFPYTQIWSGVFGDIILIGSQHELNLDFKLIDERIKSPSVLDNLSRIGINNAFTFLSTQILSSEGSYLFTNSKVLNSEIKPYLEFLAPIAFFKGETTIKIYQQDEKFDTLTNGLLIKKYIKEHTPTINEIISTIEYHSTKSYNLRFAYGLTRYLLTLDPKNFYGVVKKAELEEKLKIIRYDQNNLEFAFSLYKDSTKVLNLLANQIINENINSSSFLKIYSLKSAEKLLLKSPPKDSISLIKLYLQLSSLYLKNSEVFYANEFCKKIEDIINRNSGIVNQIDLSEFFYTYTTTAFYLNQFDKVIEYYLQLVNYNLNYEPKQILSKRIEWKVLERKKHNNTIN